MEVWKPDADPDAIVDQLIQKYDTTSMPVPDLETDPHLLISKVRKHYMEYLIKLLSINYENNQKLLNKNIYLPSAIWRCAKNIETSAVQACMVVQLYRKNIQNVINELKNDTKKGKLNKKLYDCLHRPPENEKKLQTDFKTSENCNCQCKCNDRKKRRRVSNKQNVTSSISIDKSFHMNDVDSLCIQSIPSNDNTLTSYVLPPTSTASDILTQTVSNQGSLSYISPPKAMEIPYSDELAEQLEKLFHSDPNDDDLFEGTLCSNDFLYNDNAKKVPVDHMACPTIPQTQVTNSNVIEAHEAKIKSLDERVASLAGLLANSTDNPAPLQTFDDQARTDNQKSRNQNPGKWLCEEYFLKVRLYELLDLIRETNRMGHMRIKDLFRDLFGDDSDDEGVVSPLDETPEFVVSCKERIAPWVVKLLTPYYTKGRIRGKALFKALAKHLIKLIYQCSRYPDEYEVSSFVTDFLNNHKMIRCEADFKQFRIENL
ncbi:uncharacterized protein LOC125235567 isoform X1 [Leguminivora glycinivorella]|uniref:uncharacterized protein LOC125235567 isoform X1 n=1 Tax=Leguminivora glycinivorella TaxID=1035111 RepID=UPI00200CCE5F|nr:uncharacterized protein LOC125235567 isoform X1 [Leguminivora glycinivorella]